MTILPRNTEFLTPCAHQVNNTEFLTPCAQENQAFPFFTMVISSLPGTERNLWRNEHYIMTLKQQVNHIPCHNGRSFLFDDFLILFKDFIRYA